MIEQAIKDASRKAAADGVTGKRIVVNLENILPTVPGNIVEIGGGFGDCTVYFCNVAQSMSRKVIVVDPFESGWEDMPKDYRYAYEKFEAATKGFENTLILHKHPSQSETVPDFLEKYAPISFIFVDGLQTFDAVMSDLMLASLFKVPLVCVDDYRRGFVTSAVEAFLSGSDYEMVETEETNRECYLINDK